MRPIVLIVAAVAVLAAHATAQEPPMPAIRSALADRLRTMAADGPIVVGHRGDSAAHPENTVAAFAAALRAAAQMVELDFRETRDGALVCVHDATLDRTTDVVARTGRRKVAVSDSTWPELTELDAGGWKGDAHRGARVPTLAEALDTIQAGAITMIEHKAGEPEKLVALLRSKDLLDDVLVQSFDWAWLAKLRTLEPRLTLAALGEGELTAARLAELDQLGVSMVHWDHTALRIDDIRALHDRGYLVCVYTVDPDVTLIGCAAAGIDAITTNHPGRLVELIRAGHVARRQVGRQPSGR